MKYLRLIMLCGLSFLSLANADMEMNDVMVRNAMEPVAVRWRMNRCGVIDQDRCPQISLHMSAESYEALAKPESAVYHYQAIFPHFTHDNVDVALFVYDVKDNEYYLVRTGPIQVQVWHSAHTGYACAMIKMVMMMSVPVHPLMQAVIRDKPCIKPYIFLPIPVHQQVCVHDNVNNNHNLKM